MTNLRTLKLGDLLEDRALVDRLIACGEPLLVERAEPGAAAAAIASLANTLGGWLLVGVTEDGSVTGLEAPDTFELASLVGEIEPPPPAAAMTLHAEGHTIGVVRVAESSDTPHVTAAGAVLARDDQGLRAADPATLRALLERGERGRAAARERQRGLPMIEEAMRTPDRLPGDAPILDPERYGHDAPLELIVRATPLTVAPDQAAMTLCDVGADLAAAQAIPLLVDPDAVAHRVSTEVEGRVHGVYCTASRGEAAIFADLAIDAGGVVAARLAERRQRDGSVAPDGLIDEVLLPLLRTVSGTLDGLGATGRALVGLEIRGAADLVVEWSPEVSDILRVEELLDEDRLLLDGELALPAGADDLLELAEAWARGLARAAGLPAWEPTGRD